MPSASRSLIALIGVAITLTFLSLVVTTARRSDAAAERLCRSAELTRAAEVVLADTLDAESGKRGWLLTGDAKFLTVYRRGVAQHANSLTRLEGAAAGWDAERATSADRIASACRRKFAEMAVAVGHAEAGRTAAAADLVRMDGQTVMAELRAEVQAVRDREAAYADRERRATAVYAAWSFWAALMGMAAHGLLFLLIGFAGVRP